MPLIRKSGNPLTVPVSPELGAALAVLQAGTVQERWDAARSLATLPGAAPGLGHALRSEADQRVRGAMFTSLARINSAESVDAVLPHLSSDDSNLRNGALDALKAMPGAVQARLEALLRDPDPDIRILACDLAREGPPAMVTRLLSGVLDADPSVNVCGAAVEVLAEIGGSEALPSLARCVERFPDQPFLGFAAKAARERIGAPSPRPRG